MRVIWSIAATTVGEAVRRRVLLIILLVGLLLLTIAPALGQLSARQETTVLKGFMLGMIQLTSAVIALVLTVYMIPNEIERRTIYTILSKPVQRWQFLLGKYFGAVLALALMMSLMTAVQLLIFFIQQGEIAMELARAPALFFVQMSLLAAVAIFFSTFVSPLVNFFLSGGIYLVGSVLSPLVDTLAQSRGTTPAAKIGVQVLSTVVPNFSSYNVQNPIINPGQQIQNESWYYTMVTVYGLFYVGILLVAGILIFDRREV
ncbi:MAG TPA: ABC transporter permease [Fimbriimonadaceae bacterium]|nr:ABC transporter permease [Fimbriimonadaceae bacterium]